MRDDEAESSLQGIILMVGVTVLVAGIIFLIIWGLFSLDFYDNTLAPAIIKIIGVNHSGARLESQVVLRSYSGEDLDNDLLKAVLQVNGETLLAYINTLHGTDFIPTRHFGVKTMSGSGCSGEYFSPSETIIIDLKNGYIHPGDTVELVILQKSSDTRLPPIQGDLLDSEYMERYQEEYIFNDMDGYRLFSQHRYTA